MQRGGGRRRHQLLTVVVAGAVVLLVSFVLLFRSHHYEGEGGEDAARAVSGPRRVRNKYDAVQEKQSPELSPTHHVKDAIQKQIEASNRWAEQLDLEMKEEEAAGEEGKKYEEGGPPSYHNPLPRDRGIRDVIKELFDVGKSDPEKLLSILRNDNPLGIPRSVQDPLDNVLFSCPTSSNHLLSFSDMVNHSLAKDFRERKPGAWVLYQHLRKAGGTGFCDLAKKNLQARETPPYYCMVDNKGSLATPPWNNEEKVLRALRKNKVHYRITSNEWDLYESRMGQWAGAVLATTFRHPVDRYYSQYRFEHLEHRDGSKSDAPRRPFQTWFDCRLFCVSVYNFITLFVGIWIICCYFQRYKNNHVHQMGSNYYTTTFIGENAETEEKQAHDLIHSPNKYKDFYWTYHQFQNKPITWTMFEKSLTTVCKFHLVLITEWLNSASSEIEKVLGWKIPPKRVLPHQNQAKRKAADMDALAAKVGSHGEFESYVEEKVGRGVYHDISLDNIFDILMFHCVKRLYLERLHNCLTLS